MIIGVVSRKGGVGKTTLAVHFAGLLAKDAATLLVDEDDTRNATAWSRRGHLGEMFTVTGMQGLAREAPRHKHVVIDSRGGMAEEDIRDLYQGADRIVVPASAEFMVLDTMVQTRDVLAPLAGNGGELDKLRVVMTMVRPGRKLEEARAALSAHGLRPAQATVRYSEAFKDATDQGVLVRDVKGNKLAHECWADCEAVLKEVLA